ncbi:type III toxin-antitoxin system ToxN/AbiQ family toxin [Taylorella asinigenitalis]|nr:type III toxin-antitoxin system ToxN/AbiQ family toxin [Taylorella asinigenitalis]
MVALFIMKIYIINEEYIKKLTSVDTKVSLIKNIRPKIGVIFEFHKVQYFAPLSSKDLRNKKSNYTFHLISESENLGVVHINNMVPLKDLNMVSELDFDSVKNITYKDLLMKQARILKGENFTKTLIKKADSLYQSVTKETNLNHQNGFYKKLSNNFRNLEEYAFNTNTNPPHKNKYKPYLRG